MDWLDLLAVQGTLKSLLQHHSSKASILRRSAFFTVQLSHPSRTRWTWVWVNSGRWWWTGRPGVLWFIGSQRVGHNWATELNWTKKYNAWNTKFFRWINRRWNTTEGWISELEDRWVDSIQPNHREKRDQSSTDNDHNDKTLELTDLGDSQNGGNFFKSWKSTLPT